MARIPLRWISWLTGIAVVVAIGWSFTPQSVSVEVARVSRGPLAVTVDEEARTRVHDRYIVSAPVPGYLTRIAYRPGAVVRAGQSVARVLPAPPGPIDARTRSQLEARVEAAVDALRQTRTHVESARAALAQATRDFERLRQLERDRAIAPQEVEGARTRQQVADADVNAALAGADVAEHDLEAARAALVAADGARPAGRITDIRAPREGAILRVFEQSERVVSAGTPLLEIGDPSALEIVADLLSTDAVQVSSGARVLVDRWGGEGLLNGRVRLVEPSSFTKVSALGVEEQRVNVVIDLTDPPTIWQRLGDGFALEVRVIVWERPDVLKVPAGTLFRRGDQWTVFKVVGRRAVAQPIGVGHQNSIDAEVLDGLAAGDQVIVHPSERVGDGTRVDVRS
jgi:HlyD family secretion protein